MSRRSSDDTQRMGRIPESYEQRQRPAGGGTPPKKGCRGLLVLLLVVGAPTLIGLAGLAGGAIWAVLS